MPTIYISEEAYRLVKLFSEKYCIPIKKVIDWFIFSLLDENGEPQDEGLIEALEELRPYEFVTTKELAEECGVSTVAITRTIKTICKAYGINHEEFIKTVSPGKRYEIPHWLAEEVRKKYGILKGNDN